MKKKPTEHQETAIKLARLFYSGKEAEGLALKLARKYTPAALKESYAHWVVKSAELREQRERLESEAAAILTEEEGAA